MNTVNGCALKWRLEDMNNANAGIIGINKVLDDMHTADEAEDKDHPFYHNGHIKGCLTKGIEALTNHITATLDEIKEMAGIPE